MAMISLILSTYVLNALWQIPVIAATAWVCMKFANRLPAKYRHAVWVATLLLGVVLPLMSLARPIAGSADTVGSVHIAKKDGFNPLIEKNATGLRLSGVHRRGHQVALGAKLQWTLTILYTAILVYRVLRLIGAWRRTMQLLANVKDVNLPLAIREIVNRLAQEGSLGKVLIQSSPEAASPFI